MTKTRADPNKIHNYLDFGDDYIWSVLAAGKDQIRVTNMSAILGGNVRVGLEDNIYLDRGVLASNGMLVERAVEIIERLGARVLGPDEARQKIGLHQL